MIKNTINLYNVLSILIAIFAFKIQYLKWLQLVTTAFAQSVYSTMFKVKEILNLSAQHVENKYAFF